jgi:dihydroxyacetone kinase-like protein
MEDSVSFSRVRDALVAATDEIAENRQRYNDLDSPIGDSDHGDSVCAAFKIAKTILLEKASGGEDIGAMLTSIGSAIIFSGGAATGPLYGTAFMDAGKAVAGVRSLSCEGLVKMWTAFAEGIARRGGVMVGEKTMYDTVRPAADALQNAFAAGTPLPEACRLTVSAAETGMDSTRDMISLRGRSSRLGERSRGHVDPGAASMCTVISAFFTAIAA